MAYQALRKIAEEFDQFAEEVAFDNAPRDLIRRHRNRQHGLALCAQMLSLIGHIQHHRGASLAVLAGDVFFEQRLVRLQHQIRNQLDQLLLEKKQLNLQLVLGLYQEWLTLSRQWRQDKPLTNYELHSHLIEQLLRLLWQTARQSEGDCFVEGVPLMRFVLNDLARLKELAGQMRGLVCHRLYLTEPSRRLNARIVYSLSEAQRYIANVRATMTNFVALPDSQKKLFDPAITVLARENIIPRLEAVITRVQSLQGGKSDPVNYFSLMTRIMTGLEEALQQGLNGISRSPEPALVAWIEGSPKSSIHDK
ncbi:nitrate- and nitrite sensing domain-containing protein [Parendozoicomonas sp. Alg238-R29]|uniref:nitrate- and nitrite sensing domain-containing protein n=1 Tax=Parendozoicomonas sp. Alg238-R29 TaxID=2993446 RepID=UPI00248E1BF0|nr:nitrate- and nitrite sensing domain-containing protein [Parendozoicomonas sp. Alg238-R29]